MNHNHISLRVPLTPRELEALTLLVKGLSIREIGRAMRISANTVKSTLGNVYRKLDVHSRGEAVFEAMQTGLVLGATEVRLHSSALTPSEDAAASISLRSAALTLSAFPYCATN